MSYPELSPLGAHAALERYRVIDVREEHEFRGPLGFIDCAEFVPLSTVARNAEKLTGSRPLLLVCRSGKRSGQACEALRELGVENVTNLAGGMIAWNRAGLPVLQQEAKTLTALIDQIVAWVAQVGPLATDAVHAIVRERFRRQDVNVDSPTHAAVAGLIDFFGEWLAKFGPPDLDLSLASFRRSLADL